MGERNVDIAAGETFILLHVHFEKATLTREDAWDKTESDTEVSRLVWFVSTFGSALQWNGVREPLESGVAWRSVAGWRGVPWRGALEGSLFLSLFVHLKISFK